MKYYSLNHNATNVSFQEAVIQGLAPDKGLYFPENITPLPKDFFENIENLSNEEIAFQAIHQFVGAEIPEINLKQIIAETLCFDFPTVKVEDNIYALELCFTDQPWLLKMWVLDLCRDAWRISKKTKKTIKIPCLLPHQAIRVAL